MLPIVPVSMTVSEPPSLDGVWLSVWSAVIEYFLNLSFVVALVGLFFLYSFLQCGICCHYLFTSFSETLRLLHSRLPRPTF